MNDHAHYLRLWRILIRLVRFWLIPKFRLDAEPIRAEGPILLVSNHVTAWDPLLIGMALGDRQAYYVASEHIFRQGFVSRALQWLVAPIPRRKGAASLETVRDCLKHLRAGHSVVLFAEGEQSWDGRSVPAVKGTGSLARSGGATLVTYRLEGGYLSLPRWGRGLRRGHVRGRVVGVYPPETLKGMRAGEVNALIDRDIREDAWERQRENPDVYRGRHPAEYLERMLYLCPGCRRIGTLHSRGDRLRCACGLDLRFTETGCFDPAEPFPTPAEWEDWQREKLYALDFVRDAADGALFRDEGLALSRINAEHRQKELNRGALTLYADRLVCAEHSFALSDISDMAMTQHDRLLFTVGDAYYQIRSRSVANLRKYLELWKRDYQ
ncbi:MAG: 1-acyl-sn-glycerol-3-phosphate acyltransferase [Ruminococcaceae bacterium]|nr:1-acyl-sn-glycerol-3-phosphate acyltransferase [Oscillospiraceae bacterium]